MPPVTRPSPSINSLRLERLPQGRPLWLTYTVPWPEVNFLDLLAQIQEAPRFYWASSAHPISLLGWGKAAEITDWGEQRFHDIQAQAQHLATRLLPLNPDAPGEAGPRWMGSFSFQPFCGEQVGSTLWQAFPDAYFIMPRCQLARLDSQTWLTINHFVEEANDADGLAAFFDQCLDEVLALQQAAERGIKGNPQSSLQLRALPAQDEWGSMVNGALERIQRNEFQKVVLARTLAGQFSDRPQISEALRRLEIRYLDCYRFMIEPQPGQVFLGASPELLAEVSAPQFCTAALAGTARRGTSPEHDQAFGQGLLSSPKERNEHAIVVRAIQEKLGPLTETLQIAAAPQLRKLGNVQHLETRIHGRLARGWGVLDVVAALHPTPAMGGWPGPAAQAYLAKVEPFSRGWYAAPIGWFDPLGNGLFAVAIRSGLISAGTATLFAGAGIVAGSDPNKEWQETNLKFKAILDALGGVIQHG